MKGLLALLVLAGASAKSIGQVANPYAAQNSAAIQQRAAWSTQFKNQMDQYRRFNDPYTLPAYDKRSVYYWNSQYNPSGPNYMFKNTNLWNGYGTDQQANKTVYIQDNNPDSKSSVISPQDMAKTVNTQKNSPDSKSFVISPQAPEKAVNFIGRPVGDWLIKSLEYIKFWTALGVVCLSCAASSWAVKPRKKNAAKFFKKYK